MKRFWSLGILPLLLIFQNARIIEAAVGTEGASFLEIPVGAEPAALGGAYSPLATNAYATVWNPAGLGETRGINIAAQHLSYLESIRYEFAGVTLPLGEHTSIGVAGQYLGTGDVVGRNDVGDLTDSYTNSYAAYSVSLGRSFGPLSIGITGKMIDAKLADVKARAYAGDVGLLYKWLEKATLSATLHNVGSELKFIESGDALPAKASVGLAVKPLSSLTISMQGVYQRNESKSGHFGVEWKPFSAIALRGGYRSDIRKGLDNWSGVSAGVGLQVFGQELSYAWVPFGPLGSTQYISMQLHFGQQETATQSIRQSAARKTKRTTYSSSKPVASYESDEYQLLEMTLDSGSRPRKK